MLSALTVSWGGHILGKLMRTWKSFSYKIVLSKCSDHCTQFYWIIECYHWIRVLYNIIFTTTLWGKQGNFVNFYSVCPSSTGSSLGESENLVVEETLEEKHPAQNLYYTDKETEVGRQHEVVTKQEILWPPGFLSQLLAMCQTHDFAYDLFVPSYPLPQNGVSTIFSVHLIRLLWILNEVMNVKTLCETLNTTTDKIALHPHLS